HTAGGRWFRAGRRELTMARGALAAIVTPHRLVRRVRSGFRSGRSHVVERPASPIPYRLPRAGRVQRWRGRAGSVFLHATLRMVAGAVHTGDRALRGGRGGGGVLYG